MWWVDLLFKIAHKICQGRPCSNISRIYRFPEFPIGSLACWFCLFFLLINCLYCRNIILYSPCRALKSLCLAILLTTYFKDLHSLSYQGLEVKLFCVYFLSFEIYFLAGNYGEITFSIIPLNMSHRVSVLHPSVTAHSISSNA